MRAGIRALALALWLLLAPLPSAAQEVKIVRDGDSWTADYTFPRDAPTWAFAHSSVTSEGRLAWRQSTWEIETPGVHLTRIAGHDVLIADSGIVPRKLRIRFTPVTADLNADYDPALVFSDGAVALYGGHFDVAPWSLEGEPDFESAPDTTVIMCDRSGPVRVLDRRMDTAIIEQGPSRYVLFGAAQPLETDHLTAYIDPGLPDWLRDRLLDTMPKLFALYSERLGPRRDHATRPVIMVSWAGPTPGVISLGGSALDGMVAMAMGGEGLLNPNKEALKYTNWYLAHESAHFWVGQTVSYESVADMWITEGGADLLAIRASELIDPEFDARAELQRELDGCVANLPLGPLKSADQRQQYDAYYNCGTIFGLVAEAVARESGSDFFGFNRAMMASELERDGVFSAKGWLDQLRAIGGKEEAAKLIARLLDQGSKDPANDLRTLLDGVGIASSIDEAGRLTIL